MPDREKLIDVFMNLDRHITNKDEYGICFTSDFAKAIEDVLAMLKNGVTVQEWIPVKDHNPKEPGEYTVAQKHWIDGHLESKKGKWNGVEWFVDGRESLMVSYWMPPLPLPQPPKGE